MCQCNVWHLMRYNLFAYPSRSPPPWGWVGSGRWSRSRASRAPPRRPCCSTACPCPRCCSSSRHCRSWSLPRHCSTAGPWCCTPRCRTSLTRCLCPWGLCPAVWAALSPTQPGHLYSPGHPGPRPLSPGPAQLLLSGFCILNSHRV